MVLFCKITAIILLKGVIASMQEFKIVSPFEPSGDQPEAIKELCEGLKRGDRSQVLLGVTGSGKTFTMAKIIEQSKRPALIMAPNKILAAQLYSEMKEFFPNNRVEYFVSYYDYYQPEAYIPKTDTYIEKDSAINEQIDRMRHGATRNVLEERDVRPLNRRKQIVVGKGALCGADFTAHKRHHAIGSVAKLGAFRLHPSVDGEHTVRFRIVHHAVEQVQRTPFGIVACHLYAVLRAVRVHVLQLIVVAAGENQQSAPLSRHDVETDVAHHMVETVATHHYLLVFRADCLQRAIHLQQRLVVEE